MPSLLDKVWENHVVDRNAGEPDLLYIDRHLIHEVTSPQAFEALRYSNRKLRRPDLTFAVIDHSVPTDDLTRPLKDSVAEAQLAALEKNRVEFGISSFFGVGDPRQGVIHVSMPEQGITLPGNTVVCGDSHTATHGAFGAISFGIGTSEVEHVMATQTLYQYKPKNMAIEVSGSLQEGLSSKDLILYIIYSLGMGGGTGYAIEYMGEAVRALSMEGRMTLSNMSIECGAKMGMIAPDQITYDYLLGLPMAPKGKDFDEAVQWWSTLYTDTDYKFDKHVSINANGLSPRVTWGTNPGQNISLTETVPAISDFNTADDRIAAEKALAYQGLASGTKMEDISVDYVFIGSCTNGRIEDLREAAAVLKGRKVADNVTALIVPGSGLVKAQAATEGLDSIFKEAGCQWREPGCSMCLAMNPDVVPAGKRCASTSNRNFEGRQGRDSRTHLLSPAAAAAAAVCGHFIDPRQLK